MKYRLDCAPSCLVSFEEIDTHLGRDGKNALFDPYPRLPRTWKPSSNAARWPRCAILILHRQNGHDQACLTLRR